MNYVLSLIANPVRRNINNALLNDIRNIIAPYVQRDSKPTELAAQIAYEISLMSLPPSEVAASLREAAGKKQVDINILCTENRRKKLLIADMDSTIIEQECIDELAEHAGKRAEISAITESAMRGELDFEAALKERVSMLKGLPESALINAFERRISLTPGAQTLVKTMNASGAVTALISGGFTFFTKRVAERVGFQLNQANKLIIENGVLTGTVREPILGRAAKQEALERIARENRIALTDTIAVGDGANDLSMLSRSGLGVAFRAKPAVAAAADAQINHGDLTALLYLQGVPQTEFSDA